MDKREKRSFSELGRFLVVIVFAMESDEVPSDRGSLDVKSLMNCKASAQLQRYSTWGRGHESSNPDMNTGKKDVEKPSRHK